MEFKRVKAVVDRIVREQFLAKMEKNVFSASSYTVDGPIYMGEKYVAQKAKGNSQLKKILITTDLHFTDKREDDYRWEVFDHLYEIGTAVGAKTIMILGDITDAKDRHSAELINKIVYKFSSFRDAGFSIYILKGNHDYIDPACPFLNILNSSAVIAGSVQFITDNVRIIIGGCPYLFLPHTRTPEMAWRQTTAELNKNAAIFMHHTFRGAVASNGAKMEGTGLDIFKDVAVPIFSGDIHVPQKLGNIRYVGCPYPIRFGDDFTPAITVATFDDGKFKSCKRVPVETIRKPHLFIRKPEELHKASLRAEDQVKVTLRLPRSRYHEYENLRREVVAICKNLDVYLHGVSLENKDTGKLDVRDAVTIARKSAREVVGEFIAKENIKGRTADRGMELLEDART